jgi:uncharacterized protein (DUF2141 family)
MIRLAAPAFALACLALSAVPALAQDVTVTLTGVEARGGNISGVLNTQATFMRGADYTARVSGDTAGNVILIFHDVAPGDYALMVMHDANGNGSFDMSPAGMPDEGFAFSNKGRPLMGMPTFNGLKFTVAADGAVMTEPMFYMQ